MAKTKILASIPDHKYEWEFVITMAYLEKGEWQWLPSVYTVWNSVEKSIELAWLKWGIDFARVLID